MRRPSLERFNASLKDEIQLMAIDVTTQPTLTDAWGVLSLPTTYIIDLISQPHGVNLGFATEKKLAAQLEKIAAIPQRLLPQHRHRLLRE